MRTVFVVWLLTISIFIQPVVPTCYADDEISMIDDGEIFIGVDSRKGAAITWLSSKAYQHNMVNIADPGRLIQQSYYAGKSLNRQGEGQHVNLSPWTWNPIQGGGVGSGGVNGTWARVTGFRWTATSMYSETIPKLWDMKDEDAEAVMKQWTEIELGMKGVARVRCELNCERPHGDAWGAGIPRHQEVPACYFTRRFSQTVSYLGDGKWRREHQDPGPPWGKTQPPLNAMAAFDSRGVGIGIYSPTSNQHWNFGPHGMGVSSDPMAGPCIHIAPISKAKLERQSKFGYRYWLIVGDRTTVADRLDKLIEKYSTEDSHLLNFE